MIRNAKSHPLGKKCRSAKFPDLIRTPPPLSESQIPLSFRLELSARKASAIAGLRLGDDAFENIVSISTDNEAAAREFLASPMLRRRLRRFIKDGPGRNAVISDRNVAKDVTDAHRKYSATIHQVPAAAVALAKFLSRREQIRRKEAEPTLQEKTEDLLIERLEKALPDFVDFRIDAAKPVRKDSSLPEARRLIEWPNMADFLKLETPKGFNRRDSNDKTPDGLLLVGVECDYGGFHDSRNTVYNYNGYYLTLLVFAETGEIWDARWERTD